MGTLRGATNGQPPARSRGRRGLTTFVVVAAILSAAGAFRFWHGSSQGVAVSAPPPIGASPPPAIAPPPPAPADAPTASAATIAALATVAPAPSVPVTGSASASLALSRPPVVAVARPVHVAPGASHAADTSQARPAVSVPQDMLYNPYR